MQVGFSLISAVTERWPKPGMRSLAKLDVWEPGVRVFSMQRRRELGIVGGGGELHVSPCSRPGDEQMANTGPPELISGATSESPQ